MIPLVLLGYGVSRGYGYLAKFCQAAGLTPRQVVDIIKVGWETKDGLQTKDRINILALGMDYGPDERAEESFLTDSILLLSYQTDTNTLVSVSIPRDLWISALKTKVNALYYYGEQEKNGNGPAYTTSHLSEIIGQPIDYYLVFNFESLKQLIDILGGIEVEVERSFIDSRYPLPHPELITIKKDDDYYEEISFTKGLQVMNGETALKFVRSRNSQDEIEGTDMARSQRQQKVIQAIFAKVIDPAIIRNPDRLGLLYRFYAKQIKTDLTPATAMSLAWLVEFGSNSEFELASVKIPTNEKTEGDEILVHPPITKYGQWVIEPSGGDYARLKTFFREEMTEI